VREVNWKRKSWVIIGIAAWFSFSMLIIVEHSASSRAQVLQKIPFPFSIAADIFEALNQALNQLLKKYPDIRHYPAMELLKKMENMSREELLILSTADSAGNM
jgi:hypothetical protein